jgi:hypothetical protein
MAAVWEVSITEGMYFRTSKLFFTREKALAYLAECARNAYHSMVSHDKEICRTSFKIGPNGLEHKALDTSFHQKELEKIEECIRGQILKFEVGCSHELEMKEVPIE